jgi:hypothetical protein
MLATPPNALHLAGLEMMIIKLLKLSFDIYMLMFREVLPLSLP